MLIVSALLIFLIGCFIGSFLNVLIWRLPLGQKPTGRSHCPNCGHILSVLDLFPVLSFLLFRARCRYCHQSISWRYPLIEITTGLLFALSWWLLLSQGWVFELPNILAFLKIAFIVSVLVVVFVIDLEHYLILNKVVLPATVVILLFNIGVDLNAGNLFSLYSMFVNSAIGALAGFLPFYILWKISDGKWIGLGDAKYGLFLGAVFGFPFVYLSYLLACFLGTIFSLPLLVSGKKNLTSKLPLGSFLSVAAILTLWFGLPIVSWYIGLLGF